MKKQIISIIASLLCCELFMSCNDGLLDRKPLVDIPEEEVWSDPALVNAFVMARYHQVGHGWTETMQSSVVDETAHTASRGCEPINQGYVNPSDLGRMNGAWYGTDYRDWGTEWEQISNCNLFFEKIEDVPFQDEALKKRLKGEVRFIRALTYNDLITRWGGVPIITKTYTINNVEEILQQRRASYKDCIDFIISELDIATSELPASYTGKDWGRATSVAALALKSRILLYAASSLMNEGVKSPLVGYTSPDPQRWHNAVEATKQAIDIAIANGYALYDKYGDDVKTNYRQLFLDTQNSEVIFCRQGTASADGENLSTMDQTNNPNGYGGWGGACPLQEFVDAFEMADGSVFSWSNPEHAAHPYDNRDGRFYATVLYDGAPWKDRLLETFYVVDAAGNYIPKKSGRDTKYGNDGWNASVTGYNIIKYMDETYVCNSGNFATPKNWIWLRLGELYLNLSEALYECGDEEGARAALNVIRERARMPHVTETGISLLNKIRNERRIELAFEEHRYYDVRRWKLGEEYLNKTVHGIIIEKHSDGTKTYSPTLVVENRKFYDRMYWLPILQTEIDKNPNIKQNPNY